MSPKIQRHPQEGAGCDPRYVNGTKGTWDVAKRTWMLPDEDQHPGVPWSHSRLGTNPPGIPQDRQPAPQGHPRTAARHPGTSWGHSGTGTSPTVMPPSTLGCPGDTLGSGPAPWGWGLAPQDWD